MEYLVKPYINVQYEREERVLESCKAHLFPTKTIYRIEVKLRLVEVCTTRNKHRRETSYLCSVSKLVFSERAHFWNVIVVYWFVKLIFLHIQVQRKRQINSDQIDFNSCVIRTQAFCFFNISLISVYLNA